MSPGLIVGQRVHIGAPRNGNLARTSFLLVPKLFSQLAKTVPEEDNTGGKLEKQESVGGSFEDDVDELTGDCQK